ncbi:MAG TPA: DUF6268 family outer membrane beta-barrel protein [Flavipsychrobacter sp.]|nr:DUF6268 family outer membrane beta-barrel protein [Flavipsychrobacter sp.]
MIKGRYPLLVMLLLSVCRHTMAQERDLADINYAVSRLKYNDTLADVRQLDLKLRMPLYQKHKSLLGATVGYKNVSLHHFPDSYTTALHGIIFQGAWLHKVTARRSLTLFAQAGLFSDMEDISGKDFRYSAGFRYRFKHSDKLSTGWGLAYSRQFFGNQIVPFIDVDYQPNEKWSITGQFPVKPKVMYNFNQKLSAGLELNGEVASYRLSAAERSSQFIQINQWTGLVKLEYQFARAWQLNLGIGKNFKQSYKLYNDASTIPWTIITFPIGEKADPVQKLESSGFNVQLGVSFNPFCE